MNLADPELELIDPTPNVHMLFIQFDQMFFWKRLASRAVVKWSKRMYSCAGVCSYEGRGGLCTVSLSEPLLKLRPRKDLVETLLHEMIHAFLFVANQDQDRDGHGPNFKAHMHRINKAAGLNISIYHSFHDEVELYQTHWWRCNGPCQTRKPHFGIVRRPTNRAPGPSDYWWSDHLRKCGGTFIKFKEPEKATKKAPAKDKPKGDITKYVKTKNNPPVGEPKIQAPTKSKIQVPKPVLTKSNSSSTVVVTQKGISTFNDPVPVKPHPVFTGKGHAITNSRVSSNALDAAEMVRNVWANRQLSSVVSPLSNSKGEKSNDGVQKPVTENKRGKAVPNMGILKTGGSPNNIKKATKHKADNHIDSPPVKVKKIDDYFKSTATSLLKDIYGDGIAIAESKISNKLVAVHTATTSVTTPKEVQVNCPICKLKFDESIINKHLDECLNKDIILKLTGNEQKSTPEFSDKLKLVKEPAMKLVSVENEKHEKGSTRKEMYNLPEIPAYKGKTENSERRTIRKETDSKTYRDTFPNMTTDNIKEEPIDLDENIDWEDVFKYDIPKTQLNTVKKVTDKHLRKSDSFVVSKVEKDIQSEFLPSLTAKDVGGARFPSIKQEPGTIVVSAIKIKCPCCGVEVNKAIDEHLDECLSFFDSNSTEPEEGASTSFSSQTIVIDDDDDVIDESQLLNATGTKFPCPCCLVMVEYDDMNAHIENCLG